jgi:hypothetical protein
MTDESSTPPSAASTPCEHCDELREQLRIAAAERQELLLMVARERERSNALFLAYPPTEQRGDQQSTARKSSASKAWARVRRTLKPDRE